MRIHEDSAAQGLRQLEATAQFLRAWCPDGAVVPRRG
jgi:hypothetical protein